MRANLTADQCLKKAMYYDGLSREYMDRYLEKWKEERDETTGEPVVEASPLADLGLGSSAPCPSGEQGFSECCEPAAMRVLS